MSDLQELLGDYVMQELLGEEGSGREDAGELQESEWWEVVERGGDKRSGGDMEK